MRERGRKKTRQQGPCGGVREGTEEGAVVVCGGRGEDVCRWLADQACQWQRPIDSCAVFRSTPADRPVFLSSIVAVRSHRVRSFSPTRSSNKVHNTRLSSAASCLQRLQVTRRGIAMSSHELVTAISSTEVTVGHNEMSNMECSESICVCVEKVYMCICFINYRWMGG